MRIFDLDNWQEIWITISRNKLRSALTGFGVFWGIFMLVLLIGIGNGFEGGISKEFEGMASNASFFWTGRTSEAYEGHRKGRRWTMTVKDVELVRERAQSVAEISPMVFGEQTDKNTVRGSKSGGYSVVGIYPSHFVIQKMDILYGRAFNDLDISGKRKTCVIGKEVYETLFSSGTDPLGEYIRVNGIYFQVVGVVNPISDIHMGSDPISTVFIPFSTMQMTFSDSQDIYFMACTAKPGYPASVVEDEVKTIIKAAHNISPTDEKAMGGFNTEEIFMAVQMLFIGVSIVIWVVGIGALLSGIIGISNIMLVTVKERTREIGVRRAIGAKPYEIVMQIISESFVLTVISGFLGLFVAVLILSFFDSLMVNEVIEIKIMTNPIVPFKMSIAALITLLISGILAGLFPALRALKIKAIDAIRDE